MDEVSIDIRLNSNVAEEATKASSAIQEMAQDSVRIQRETQISLDITKQVVARLRREYEETQKQLARMKFPTKEKQELQRTSHALLRELKDEEQAIKTLEAELAKMNSSYGLINTQMRKTKAEMATLAAAGKRNSEEYRRLERDLQELAKAQALVNRTGQEMAKGNRSLKGLTDAVSAFSGAASAAVGAWTLMGGSQEEQAKIQTKLQSLMAITIGLQQVQNVLLESSTFRIQTVTKAKQLWATANTRLATALGISNTAAKALTGTLTLGLSVAIGALIAMYDKWVAGQKKAREEQERLASITSSKVGDTIATYKRLQTEFATLNGDLRKQEQFVRDNADAFRAMGVKVDDARMAENLLVNNTETFGKSLILRAKAAVSMELAAEQYKESIRKMMEADERAAKPTAMDKWMAIEENVRQWTLGLGWNGVDGKYMAGFAAGDLRREGKQSSDAGDSLIANALQFEEEYKALWQQIGLVPVKEIPRGANEAADIQQKLLERLARITRANEEELTAIVLASLREGRAKKLRELEIENDKRKTLLKKRRRELEEIAKSGVDTSAEQSKLKLVSDKGDEEYLRKVAEAHAASDKIISEVEGMLDSRVATRREERIQSARAEYQKLRQEATDHARDKEELSQLLIRIAQAEQAEVSRILMEGELERIDFEEMIALRRIQVSTKRYNLETEREEELLETELNFAQIRKAKLEELQANGADVALDLEEVTERIQDLSKAMAEMPARKFEELARGVQGMLGTLSKMGGEIGSVFGSLSDSVGLMLSGLKKGATTLDKIGSALGGVMQVADVAIQQAKANEAFMRAWQEANESALQVARMQRIAAAGADEGNIFGVGNPYTKAIAGARQYAQAMYELQDLSRSLAEGRIQVGKRKTVSAGNIVKGAGGGAAAGAVLGSIIPGLGTAIGAGIGALIGGIFGGSQRKLVPVFESLGKKYGEIYNKDTFALNPKILQDYQKLDDATKKLVDNWDAVQKKAKEAQEQMRENFRSLSGDIGNQLSEALKKGLADGDIYAAFDDFKAYASKVIHDIGEQMIFAQFFQESFDELQRRMEKSFGIGGDGDITDDIRWLVGAAKGNIEGYKQSMDAFRAELERQGMRLPDRDVGRKAEARGIGRMTQDSAERLEGLMTVQVDRLSTLVNYAKQADDYRRDVRVYQATIIRQIDRIAANSDYLRKLEGIANDLYRLNQEGIYLKK